MPGCRRSRHPTVTRFGGGLIVKGHTGRGRPSGPHVLCCDSGARSSVCTCFQVSWVWDCVKMNDLAILDINVQGFAKSKAG